MRNLAIKKMLINCKETDVDFVQRTHTNFQNETFVSRF